MQCIRKQASLQLAGRSKAEPLVEGLRTLSKEERAEVFARFYPSSGARLAMRFSDARESLRERFNAEADIAKVTGSAALRFRARLRLLTQDRSLDQDLYNMVCGMGFSIILRTSASGDSTYIISEGKGSLPELRNFVLAAENLIRLADMLLNQNPENVIPIGCAKNKKTTNAPAERVVKALAS